MPDSKWLTVVQRYLIDPNSDRWRWIAASALCFGILISMSSWVQLRDASQAIKTTRTAVLVTYEIAILMTEAEASQRGYLINGLDEYLTRYQMSKRQFEDKIQNLRQARLKMDSPHPAVEQLNTLCRMKFAEMESTIQLRRKGDIEGVLSIVKSNLGASLMDQIRTNIGLIVDSNNTRQLENFNLVAQRNDSALAASVVGLLTLFVSFLYAHASLRRQTKLAMRANAAKSQFLANMSHELRTPLNAIIGYSQLLQEQSGSLTEQQNLDDLSRIESSGRHLLELINSILDLSKVEAGKMNATPGQFSWYQLVDEVCGMVKPQIEEKGNRLVIDLEGKGLILETDRRMLKQILLNLLSNAAKFTDNGQITIKSRSIQRDSTKWLEVAVTDTGIGIAPEALSRIFEPFIQADSDTTRRFGGTGLGLSIVKSFADLLGGAIEVQTQPGEGSSFVVSIPMRFGPHAADLDGEESQHQAPKILVIDDDPNICDLLARILRKNNYSVFLAHTAGTGLDLARELIPDGIVLDLILPDMDGFVLLSTLKSDPLTSQIPVIVVSIKDGDETGYRLGAVDFLSKPLDHNRLLGAIQHFRHPTSSRKILILEDDAFTRNTLQQVVSNLNWVVSTASNGKEGLAHLEVGEPPSLIFLDLMMPEMDGFQFLQHLAERDPLQLIPVIVVTSLDVSEEESETMKGRVVELIRKGDFDAKELAREIPELLARHGKR